ncbi:MAG: hypothetical protein Q8R28_04240, partial [Dehalococcoidia bacterium]|nr:hypothetical protein [Dehalococcoidia bacterium]
DGRRVVLGADASTSRDLTALVGVSFDPETGLSQVLYARAWKPERGILRLGKPTVDLDETVKPEILRLHKAGNLVACYYDPYQLHSIGLDLEKAGVKMIELPQTSGRIAADQQLYDGIIAQTVRHSGDPQLTEHALAAVALETPRGFRLAKERASSKIDLMVALSMANYGAVALLNRPAGVIQWAESPFYGARTDMNLRRPGEVEPGQMYDDYGWRVVEHKNIPIDYHHCPDREPGCRPCWARAKALVAARDVIELQAMKDELRHLQTNVRMFGGD